LHSEPTTYCISPKRAYTESGEGTTADAETRKDLPEVSLVRNFCA
jgi:hypothetical protein